MTDSEPIRFVFLTNGNVVPEPAITIVMALERKGLKLWVEGDDIIVEGRIGDITPDDRAELKRWKRHAIAILNYHDDTGDDRQLYGRRPPIQGRGQHA